MARILVIEDNADNLELMVYLLEAFGHAVTTAVDGAGGLAAAASERPEVILCDLHLPGIDGYEVCRRLKADPALRRIPLLAVTASAMATERARGFEAGFVHGGRFVCPEFLGQLPEHPAPVRFGALQALFRGVAVLLIVRCRIRFEW